MLVEALYNIKTLFCMNQTQREMKKMYTYIIKHLVQLFGVHNKLWITNHVVYCICLDKNKKMNTMSEWHHTSAVYTLTPGGIKEHQYAENLTVCCPIFKQTTTNSKANTNQKKSEILARC